MNKEWIKAKEAENKIALEKEVQKAIDAINKSNLLSEEFKQRCINLLENPTEDNLCILRYALELDVFLEIDIVKELEVYRNELKDVNVDNLEYLLYYTDLSDLLDSEPMEFDGDIIITDPCYVMRSESGRKDWYECECGYKMESLGIRHYMTRDTIYGDWSCTTYNSDTGEEIGRFCADAGLVSVFLLDEILKYNPDYNEHIKNPWAVTLIKNFKGTVQFVVKRTEGVYEDTTKYHKKGDTWTDDSVQVVGHGINKLTGEPINFVGKQSGF